VIKSELGIMNKESRIGTNKKPAFGADFSGVGGAIYYCFFRRWKAVGSNISTIANPTIAKIRYTISI